MTKTIWKAALTMQARQGVIMPRGATILSCQVQDGAMCLWFSCDPAAPSEARLVQICGTGHNAPPDGATYLGTCAMEAFVWHVFEIPAP